MGRRRKPKLAVGTEPLELPKQIKPKAPRKPSTPNHGVLLENHKTKARPPFEALVSRGDEIIEPRRLKINRHAAETTHRIHHVNLLVPTNHGSDLFNRVDDA